MARFAGFVELGGSISFLVVAKDENDEPEDGASLPVYRVYGATGTLMTNGSGSVSKKNTGTITGATNASPIEITSVAHGLQTGMRVVVASVGGNTNANDTWVITRTGADTFTLTGSTGNSAYTSGGTWHVAGLYGVTISAAQGDGYDRNQTYTVLVEGTVGSRTWSEEVSFSVV